MPEVTYERQAAAAVITIDRPERRNAVDPSTADQLTQRAEGLGHHEAVFALHKEPSTLGEEISDEIGAQHSDDDSRKNICGIVHAHGHARNRHNDADDAENREKAGP